MATSALRSRRWLRTAGLAVACALPGLPVSAATVEQTVAPDVVVKAAFVFNFAKFTEWPALPPGAPLTACVVGNDELARALGATIAGRQINGRAVVVSQPVDPAVWPKCHLLFVSDAAARQPVDGLTAVRTRPVLTVSDSRDFARARGIIELYVENGRIRFAINSDAAERAGLHLSSQLLGLAKVIRDRDAQ